MSTDQITLRPASSSDSDRLLEWRNEPTTRENSLDQKLIPKTEHEAWFLRSLALAPNRLIFIGESAEGPIGSIRADLLENGCYQLSWMVAPHARGRGFGKQLLRQFCRKFAKHRLTAQIKATNGASIGMVEACGFKLDSTSDGVQLWLRDASAN